jgi:subtilisin family serine protease
MTRASGAGMARTGAALLIVALVVGLATCTWATPDPRIVNPSVVDKNGDRISDSFAAKVANQSMATVQADGVSYADLIVALDHAPNAADVGAVSSLGGDVPNSWHDLVYAIHVRMPIVGGRVEQALDLVKQCLPGVVVIEENARSEGFLYRSTQMSGARYVWNTYGYDGDPNIAIAVMDTGLTSNHADIPGSKILAWHDEIGSTLTPADYNEHGTHVGGIAAGSGAAAGLSTPGATGWVFVGYDHYFCPTASSGWVERHPIDTRNYVANATIRGWLEWIDNKGGSYNVSINLFDGAGHGLSTNTITNGGAQPLMTSYAGVYAAPGIYDYKYFALPTCNIANNNVSPTWTLIDAPMSAIGDGYNLMCGVAPFCSLVGVKVLNDSATGTSTDFLNGLTWIRNNAVTYKIKVVNMSMGFASVIGSLDTAVNNAVGDGLVLVAAAGNSRGTGTPYIYSPASASKCVAVAAINAADKITDYSSYGSPGASKPEVAAYGGGNVYGGNSQEILSVDSGDGERNYDPSTGTYHNYPEAWAEDDYRYMQGTSMACPHVAGEAALMVEAAGGSADPLMIKQIIGMTCTETNQTAEVLPNPTLNRGAKDTSEGYGRFNIDAAIEAMTLTHTIGGAGDTGTLGPTSLDNRVFNKHCWARMVNLNQKTAYQFDLVVPAAQDFDLYLYQPGYTNDGSDSNGSIGDPVIVASSVNPTGGVDERINYSCCATGTYYIVVKLVGGSGTFTLTSQSYTFDDVLPNHPFRAQIEAMLTNGITSGCLENGTCARSYCPTNSVTRGQMASFLCKAAGQAWLNSSVATFTDVSRGTDGIYSNPETDGTHPFYGYIERLVDGPSWGGTAPTSGCGGMPGNLQYCPAGVCTRGQMAKFICAAVGKTELNNPTPTFTDVPLSHPLYGWIERLADGPSWPGGVAPTSGCGGTPGNLQYCPTGSVTRGQMAKFLCTAFAIPF